MLAVVMTMAVAYGQALDPPDDEKPAPKPNVQFKLENAGGEGKETTIRLTVVNKSEEPFLFDTKGGTGLVFQWRDTKGEFQPIVRKKSSAGGGDDNELDRILRIVMPGEKATCELQPFNGYIVHSAVVGSGRDANGRRAGVVVRDEEKETFDVERFHRPEIEIRCTLVASRSFGLIRRTLERPGNEPKKVGFPAIPISSNTLRLKVPKP